MKTIVLSRSLTNHLCQALSLVALCALAGCATNNSNAYNGPVLGQTVQPGYAQGMATETPPPGNLEQPTGPSPAQATAQAMANLDIDNFVSPKALTQLTLNSRSQAADAQFSALQFGRVGANRTWNGDSKQSGTISVGPYVKVNNRDCRDFTNIVNVGDKSYPRRGTACRDIDGRWSVAGQGTAALPGAGTPGTSTPAATGAFNSAG